MDHFGFNDPRTAIFLIHPLFLVVDQVDQTLDVSFNRV